MFASCHSYLEPAGARACSVRTQTPQGRDLRGPGLPSPCGQRPVGCVEASAPCSAPLSTDAICLSWPPGGWRASGLLPAHRLRLVLPGSLSGIPLRLALAAWTWRARGVSAAQGCLLIFPEPMEGPWVARPGTWGRMGTDPVSQGARPHSGLQKRPQQASPEATAQWGSGKVRQLLGRVPGAPPQLHDCLGS